ncbi:hypothetical protein PSHT_01273 [Puccinia striiformis]|uniref:Uncharacterized protein n=1 Tax=Puccinia striiformis TaxID=27350 RepID=A0A2S4WL04_9BASI|nr:hypothetical protein PSHT_01273 [Puccinia striiformis]
MPVTANGSIQTARKIHVANTTLNLASNQSSITFVERWAKTPSTMNEIAACHRIQGFLVIASGKSSGDLFETGGTTLGVSFLNMLIKAGDPLRKFHTYAAGMSVVEELTNVAPVTDQIGIAATPSTQKQKHCEMEEPAQEASEATDEQPQREQEENQQTTENMLNDTGGKKFSGWPGLHAACELDKAHIQVKIKKNTHNFTASELFQPIKAINIETSQRILRAIGEGWIRLKYQEDNTPVDSDDERGEPAAKRPKRAVANNRAKQSQNKKSACNDKSEEEAVESLESEEDDE